MDYKIIAIKRDGLKTDCTCITHIKTSTDHIFSVSDVLAKLDTHSDRFYVVDPKDGSTVFVTQAEKMGRRYIRTKPNDTPDDNLLKLPEF